MQALDRFDTPALVVRVFLAASALLFAVFVAAPASAHAVGVSRGEYRRVPAGLEARLTFSRSELAIFGAEPRVAGRIEVRTDDSPCRVELERAAPLERDGVGLTALFRCSDAGRIHVSLAPLLRELGRGHRHEATVLPSRSSSLLLEAEPRLVVEAEASPSDAGAPAEAGESTLIGFVRLGIEHILTGYDHLVFLLGLVVVGLGTRRSILVASAFALAHSLSLAACTLGAWTPPSSIVEPAIALSIAYVGIENLVTRSHARRAWLAFAFGVIHGFGFASVLADAEFGGVKLALALAGFNAGVELGQLFVLALLLPLVGFASARPTLVRYGVPAVSLGVAAMGAVWFVTRVYDLA